MRYLKPFLTFALCLIVLATSVSQAVAWGQMATGQMVVICAGGQAVTVMMDAQGNPVARKHTCPDCAAIVADLPPAALTTLRPTESRAGPSPPFEAVYLGRSLLQNMARGPPALI
jgi:hypothetical protein